MTVLSGLALAAASATVPIPPPDPLGYPVPVEILRGLSYLTLTLHFLAMSFTLGGVLLLLLVKLVRKPGQESVSRYLATSLPLGFSYLVTLGVPPLLFVQVTYGQLFYSSSVIMASYWLHVIPLLVVAYGLLYLNKLTGSHRVTVQRVSLAVALASMLSIGFIYVNNLTLAQSPAQWADLYAANTMGRGLNLAEPTLWPRFTLFLSPSLAVAGLGLLVAAAVVRRRGRSEEAAPFVRLGTRSLLGGFVLHTAGLVWTVASLPPEIRALATAGGLPTLLLAAAVGLELVAVALALATAARGGLAGPVVSAVLVALSLACVVVVRDLLRIQVLAPFWSADSIPVHPQWGMFGIFAASLVAGLVLLVVFTVKVVRNLSRG